MQKRSISLLEKILDSFCDDPARPGRCGSARLAAARIWVWWLRRFRDELGLASRSGGQLFATSLGTRLNPARRGIYMAAYTVLSLFLLSLIVFVNTAPFYWPLPPFVWLTAARLSQLR